VLKTAASSRREEKAVTGHRTPKADAMRKLSLQNTVARWLVCFVALTILTHTFLSQPLAQTSEKQTEAALTEATQLSAQVVTLFNSGDYDKALPLAKRALQLRESVLAPDHELVLAALLNLAETYTALKKYGEAEKLLERLLKTHESKVGPDDAGAAIFLDKLAFLAFSQGDFRKSEADYTRALAIREQTLGKEDLDYAKSLYSLAEFYRLTGKPEKAEPLYEQAVILRGKLLGRSHPDYLKARERYFCLAYQTHQADKLKDFMARLGEKRGDSAPDIIEGNVLNGRAISLPKPYYTLEAHRLHLQGMVVVRIIIDETGRVVDAKDMCGSNPLLLKSSLESARAARFTPTLRAGQPVKVSGVLTYTFVRM
jgi:TonB family protein